MTDTTAKPITAKAFLGLANGLQPVQMGISELGGFIHIRQMTGAQREDYERAVRVADDNAYRATLVQASVCDADNKLMFEPSDIAAINTLPTAVLVRICNKSNKINGLMAEFEQIEKN